MNKEAQHNSNLTTACIEWEKTRDVATALLRTLLQYPVAGGCSAAKSPQNSCLPPVHKRHLAKFYAGSHPAALKCSGTEDGHWSVRLETVSCSQRTEGQGEQREHHTAHSTNRPPGEHARTEALPMSSGHKSLSFNSAEHPLMRDQMLEDLHYTFLRQLAGSTQMRSPYSYFLIRTWHKSVI